VIQEQKVETEFFRTRMEMRSKRFLASIPLDWVVRAARLPGKALQVALAIHHQSKLEKRNPVALGNALLKAMDVSRDSKRRALDALEEEGLVVVERGGGRKPHVKIINVEHS